MNESVSPKLREILFELPSLFVFSSSFCGSAPQLWNSTPEVGRIFFLPIYFTSSLILQVGCRCIDQRLQCNNFGRKLMKRLQLFLWDTCGMEIQNFFSYVSLCLNVLFHDPFHFYDIPFFKLINIIHLSCSVLGKPSQFVHLLQFRKNSCLALLFLAPHLSDPSHSRIPKVLGFLPTFSR